MRTFFELARAEFRRFSSYRLAVVAGVFTNSVFGFIRASVLLGAVDSAGGNLAGYTREQASSYVWLGQALLASVAIWGWSEIADRVKNGEIAVDLARPVDLYFSWWARDLGRAAFTLPARGLPPFLVGALLMGVTLPTSPSSYLLGVVSLVLAVSISFTLRFLINLAAFWVIDIRGLVGVSVVVSSFFCGLFVPVHLFPDWLRTIAYATPFPALLQYPIDVFSARATGLAALQAVGVQAAWLIGLVALSRLVLLRASRRLVVQGG